jgi:hypothetical protein
MIRPQTPLTPWMPQFEGAEWVSELNYKVNFGAMFREELSYWYSPTELPVVNEEGTMDQSPVVVACRGEGGAFVKLDIVRIDTIGTGFVVYFETDLEPDSFIVVIRPNAELGWIDERGTACSGGKFVADRPPGP